MSFTYLSSLLNTYYTKVGEKSKTEREEYAQSVPCNIIVVQTELEQIKRVIIDHSTTHRFQP